MGEGEPKRGVVFDDRLWPLVISEVIGDLSDDEWFSIFPIYEKLYARRAPFQVLNDNTRLGKPPGAKLRREFAERSQVLDDKAKRYLLGSAVVISNPLYRGMLTALNWLAPPPYKQTVHANRLDALDEILRTFEQHRIPISAEIRAYHASLLADKR